MTKYRCKICGAEFDTIQQIQNHGRMKGDSAHGYQGNAPPVEDWFYEIGKGDNTDRSKEEVVIISTDNGDNKGSKKRHKTDGKEIDNGDNKKWHNIKSILPRIDNQEIKDALQDAYNDGYREVSDDMEELR